MLLVHQRKFYEVWPCCDSRVKLFKARLGQLYWEYLDWKWASGWLESRDSRTVVSDWGFDNLCRSHLQSQVTLKMASAQVVKCQLPTTVNSQDLSNPDHHFQSGYITPGFKPLIFLIYWWYSHSVQTSWAELIVREGLNKL